MPICACGCGREFEVDKKRNNKKFFNFQHYLKYSKRVNTLSLKRSEPTPEALEAQRLRELSDYIRTPKR